MLNLSWLMKAHWAIPAKIAQRHYPRRTTRPVKVPELARLLETEPRDEGACEALARALVFGPDA